MMHYTKEEWMAYKKGLTDMKQTMEQHLHDCAQCKKLFLELIDELEINRAGRIIPEGFSTSTMQYIKNQQFTRKSPGYGRNLRRKLLSYYAIAAVITLMLVNQGFFQLTFKDVSKIPVKSTQEKVEPLNNLIFNWPQMLTEESSNFTQIFSKRVNFEEVIQ